jgi:hypothetical protein
MGSMRKKPYRKKNNLAIESSDVKVWLVWILTTKRIKESVDMSEEAFRFLTVLPS